MDLEQRVAVLEASMILYVAHVENLIERVYALEQDDDVASSWRQTAAAIVSDNPEALDQRFRELAALERNGAYRTPQQEERFQTLLQQRPQRPWSYMMDTPEGAVDTRSILVKVLSEHEGEPLRQQGELRDGGKWVCNCTWEGDDHAEHVADMYETALSQLQGRSGG